VRVIYYANQFFAGVGGEEQAGVGPAVRAEAVGPGGRLKQLLAPEATVVGTVFCGDNYFADHADEAAAELLALIRPLQPELAILGPAFNSGRYGLACAHLAAALVRELGIPAITGMYDENPGLDLARDAAATLVRWEPSGPVVPPLYVVRTDADARAMAAALERMAALAHSLWQGATPSPAEGGYFPRGLRLNRREEQSAAERAIGLLVQKLRGEAFTTELPRPAREVVPPAPPVPSLAGATVALVTDGGLIVAGNPEGMTGGDAERWCAVDVAAQERLDRGRQEVNHRGYDTTLVNEDPNRLVPLDVARDLEREGRIGRLLPTVYATAGCSAPVANARRVGREIADALREAGVDAAIVTST
jgi:glycine reductase complex component B subunit gamma